MNLDILKYIGSGARMMAMLPMNLLVEKEKVVALYELKQHGMRGKRTSWSVPTSYVHISVLYPDKVAPCPDLISKLIDIVNTPELRKYNIMQWHMSKTFLVGEATMQAMRTNINRKRIIIVWKTLKI